ncbi:hypothetical protein EJ07DRAFT_151698 [Lizonia empirigonia]|nr:hypothetical protein EJ07DRAFT_151698 [Lizonia empirigonia]
MAFHRIERDDDHQYPPPWPTPTDDEDDDPKSSSFVIKEPLEISTPYLETPSAIPSDSLLSIYSYPPIMSGGPPYKPSDWNPDTPYQGPSRTADDDYGYGPSSALTTFSTKSTPYWDHNGSQSTHVSPTPTVIPTDDSSPPEPTDDGYPALQNNGADDSPSRTPMYAAAGVAPVVVIIIAVLLFFCLRKRRRQRQAAFSHGHVEEMKQQPKPIAMPYISPPSPPPAALPQYSPSSPSSSHPPTASSSQPVILGPILSGNNGAYLTGMDTSDLVSMTSASNISRMGTIVDRDPFADGRSLEEAPPPYRPSSLPPASLASASRNSSVRVAAAPRMTSRTHLIERSPFDDPEDDDISIISGPTLGRSTDALSDVSDLSYQVNPVVGRSPF